MTPFDRALARTLEHEGGLSDHALDRGGRTNWGVTQKTYDSFRITHGLEKQRVDDITWDEIRVIYHDDYWKPAQCDALPERLGAALFDMAVNSGVWNAKITLQNALRVRADGVIGPVTIKAAQEPDALLKFLKGRAGFYRDIVQARPSQVVFLHGWINRLLDQAWASS